MKFKNYFAHTRFSKLAISAAIFLPLMFAFQNCGYVTPFKLAESFDAPSTELVLDGKALYVQNCASCHGPVDSSSKRNRSASQISIAVQLQPEMAAIHLSEEQLALIAQVLNPSTNVPPPVVNEDNRAEFACTIGDMQKTPLVKLTNREYKNALFALLNLFDVSLRNDATLLTLIDAFPTDIAIENRDTNKEQSLLVTGPISNALFNASYRAAELVASATSGLTSFTACLSSATITQSCHQTFMLNLASRAFRRQLTTTEGNAVAARFWDASLSKTDLLKTSFAGVAMMPDFLYKIYDQGTPISSGSSILSLTGGEMAAKMAWFLTGAPPDATLKAVGDNGTILTDAVIIQQVDRLLATTAARDMVRRLFRESYGYDVFTRLDYDSTYSGGMNTTGLSDVMTTELDNYFVEVVLNQSGSFLDAMTSRYSNATDSRLLSIYGVSSSASLPEVRSGFLSRAAMLTKRSGFTTSPIKRGLGIIEHVLCQDIGLPPPSAPTSLPTTTEDLITTRMKTAHATEASGSSCVLCHGRFNNLGYAFENFDSLGRFRTSETIYKNSAVIGSLTVDPSYTSSEITGKSVTGSGPRQMVEHIGKSDRALMCFVQHLKRFEARVPAEASANCQMNASLKTMYGDNTTQGSIVGAIKSLVLSPEFRRWKN